MNAMLVISLFGAAVALYYHRKILPTDWKDPSVISTAEVARARGDAKMLILCIVGHCYDVSSGRRFYGTDGAYHFFAGTDATRAFATGDFTNEGLVAVTSGLSPRECESVTTWLDFFRDHDKYVFVGYLQDSPYILQEKDSKGLWTPLALDLFVCADQGRKEMQKESSMQTCNTSHDVRKGTGEVWCNARSAPTASTTATATTTTTACRSDDATCSDTANADTHTLMVPRLMTYRLKGTSQGTAEKCVCTLYEEAKNRLDLKRHVDSSGTECAANAARCGSVMSYDEIISESAAMSEEDKQWKDTYPDEDE